MGRIITIVGIVLRHNCNRGIKRLNSVSNV